MSVCTKNNRRFRPVLFLMTALVALAAALPTSAKAQTGYRLQRLITPSIEANAFTVGPDGLLYIAGWSSNIEVRTTSGALVKTIPVHVLEGISAAALRFDTAGDLHVVTSPGLVARLRGGSLVQIFGVNVLGRSNHRVNDMAVARDGSYYFVTESSEGAMLQKHDASGRLQFLIPVQYISSESGATLHRVALSARGDVHVMVGTDSNVTVEVFSSSGSYLRRLQMPANVNPEMIYNVVSDPSGNIVVNSRLHEGDPVLVTFSPEGGVLRTNIGGFPGPVPSLAHFEQLAEMAFDRAGNLFVFNIAYPIVSYRPAPNARIFFRKVPEGRTIERAAEFMFATDTSTDRFECSLDGAPFAVCSSTKRYTGLRQGNHVFRVRVRGNARTVEAHRWAVQ